VAEPEDQPSAALAAGAGEITRMLAAARDGDRAAFDGACALVYKELRRIARGQRRRGVAGATLSTTALVHEAYVKLLPHAASLADREHFFAVAARAMRQILIDAARRRLALKRGGAAVPLDDEALDVPDRARADELVAIDDALSRLEQLDPQLAMLVELRYFGGLSIEETAAALAISDRSVRRYWCRARAFLQRELERAGFTE
jgi:RNA polymerase sigma factor (TIGR02999 family)